jgi:hypothetical protein
MSRIKDFIMTVYEYYKKALNSEPIDEINSMDFLLQDLERQAAENRKKIVDLGFWAEDGEYKEDLQEIKDYEI